MIRPAAEIILRQVPEWTRLTAPHSQRVHLGTCQPLKPKLFFNSHIFSHFPAPPFCRLFPASGAQLKSQSNLLPGAHK
jgi:hypothetical protein